MFYDDMKCVFLIMFSMGAITQRKKIAQLGMRRFAIFNLKGRVASEDQLKQDEVGREARIH